MAWKSTSTCASSPRPFAIASENPLLPPSVALPPPHHPHTLPRHIAEGKLVFARWRFLSDTDPPLQLGSLGIVHCLSGLSASSHGIQGLHAVSFISHFFLPPTLMPYDPAKQIYLHS